VSSAIGEWVSIAIGECVPCAIDECVPSVVGGCRNSAHPDDIFYLTFGVAKTMNMHSFKDIRKRNTEIVCAIGMKLTPPA
jgi:hypothetical protein